MISWINRFCEKHRYETYIIIGLAIIFPFVFFYGVDWGANTFTDSVLSRSAVIGDMYGRSISRSEFFQHMNGTAVKYFLDSGNAIDTSQPRAAQALSEFVFNRMRALHLADQLGINHVTDEQVRKYITRQPQFQTENNFDRNKFTGFQGGYLTFNGIKPRMFDQIVRENIIIERIEQRVTGALTIPEPGAKAVYFREFSKTEAQVARFTGEQYRDDVEVTEAEIEEYFNDNVADKYMIPEKKKLRVASFSATDFEGGFEGITDEDIRNAYEERKSRLYARKQVHVRHILIQSTKSEVDIVRQQKRERLEGILKVARESNNFAELAKQYSEDDLTKADGGDLRFKSENLLEAAFAKAAFALRVGEISDVVETNRGFQIIEKLDERDVIPLDEVRDGLKRYVRTNRDADIAREIYDRDKEAKYAKEEFRASHILIKSAASESNEEKQQKRTRAEDILVDARKAGADFAALAREHSEGPTGPRGGDLDWFGQGRMVPPFEKAIIDMKVDDISGIVETVHGFHIIKKTGARDYLPFEEAQREIQQQLRVERRDTGRLGAQEAVYGLAEIIFQQLGSVAAGDKSEKFSSICATYDQPMKIRDSEFFSGDDRRLKGIPGNTSQLVNSGTELDETNPVTSVVDGGNFFYIACLLDTKEPLEPAFKELARGADSAGGEEVEMVLTEQARQADRDLKDEKAREIAILEGCTIYDEIRAKMDAEIPFEEAIGDVEFEATGAFVLNAGAGPPGDDGADIRRIAEEFPDETLAEPVKTDKGATIVYVSKQYYPTTKDYERALRGVFYTRERQQAELKNFYGTLAEASGTEITEDWQFLLEEPAPVGGGGGGAGGSGSRNTGGSGGR